MSVALSSIKKYIRDIDSVTVYKYDDIKNIIVRYFIIRMITYLIKFLKYIRNKIDIDFGKIQFNKKFSNGSQYIILENTNISKGIKILDESHRDDNLGNIFLKFELVGPSIFSEPKNQKVICLKEYFMKYRDSDKKYDNTLENILIFNRIEASEKSEVNILLISNKKRISKKISYDKCKDWHINDFNNSDKLEIY